MIADARRWSRMFVTVSVVAILFTGVTVSTAVAGEAKQILLLQSAERGSLVFDRYTEIFRAELDARLGEPVTVIQFVVAPPGDAEPPEAAMIDYLKALYADRSQPDLIVSIAGPAASFARRHRRALFPDVPMLYAAVEQRFLGLAPLAQNETSETAALDHAGLVDDILMLLPDTTQLFVLIASGPSGQFWRTQLQTDLKRFEPRMSITYDYGLSYAEMLDRSAHLPEHSAILMVSSGTDSQGGWHGGDRTVADVAARANAPLFGIHQVWLGLGAVGGRLADNGDLAVLAAQTAVRILKGESPGTIRSEPTPVRGPRFDARQLLRWSIPESRLPLNSTVLFRPPSLWRDYRGTVLGAIAILLLESSLIVGLLYQRRARRRAEVQSRKNLTLAADANRRLTMTALTGSIAHELSQPLNSILHNAQAGEMLVASNRATPEALAEILTDIRESDLRASQIIERHRTMLRNRQVEMKPLDLHAVIRESVALLAHDVKARQVVVDVRLLPDGCVVTGDQVLLQQVFVNLMINAMDAMGGVEPSNRRITIDHQHSPAEARITLTDSGTGLPDAILKDLFEPFVTTKTHGIGVGLTIARTIVEAHRGQLTAANNPGGGATFSLVLPRENTPTA